MQTLVIKNLNDVPFSDYVKKLIAEGLKPLADSGDLEIDFTGKGRSDYSLSFEKSYDWISSERDHCWYQPMYYGVTASVNVESLQKANYCDNVRQCHTCEPIFRHKKDELGKQIAYTALHEIGHVLGIKDESSFKGANSGGHTADSRNYMFAITLHADYLPRIEDYKKTVKYTIKKGDSISKIASRKGLKWRELYDFKGQDGRKNREILSSGDPDLIYPGEEIWIPDDNEMRSFKRRLELQEKSFTKPQFDTMRRSLEKGETLMEIEYR
jgi:hypothetical protein